MDNKPNAGLLIGFIVMTLVSAVFGYLYYHERSITQLQEKDLEVRVIELVKTEMKLDSISKQLDIRIEQVRTLGGNVAELKRIKAQLEADRAELRKGNAAMASRIIDYENYLTQKDEEIGLLRTENKSLSTQNKVLATVNTTLLEEKQQLTDSLSGIITKAIDLESKVNRAAVLRARGVKVMAISAKGKERDGDEVRARRVDNIRVDFILEKNSLTKQDTKTIYMKVLDPKGATLADASMGSGLFENNGNYESYTLRKDVTYTNDNQSVSILYNRTQSFQKGTYTIELYAEGFNIGQGSFTIK